MVKHSVGSILLLISLITFVSSKVNAQGSQRIEMEIPFSFVIAGQPLSAGTYVVERTDSTKPNILTLKNIHDGVARVILTQRVETAKPSSASSLIFIQRKGKLYLYQVWNVGAMNGNQIPGVGDKRAETQRPKGATLVTLKTRH